MSDKRKFTFITYDGLPDLDPDDRLAVDELRKLGAECAAATWNDKNVDWSTAGICVLRSTWDYHLHLEQFLSWLNHVADQTTVWNSAELVRWNINKRYLLDLEHASIPVVPTTIISKDTALDIKQVLHERGWHKAVIKPAIGLSTYGVKVIDDKDEQAQNNFEQLLSGGDILLQPYIESVEQRGERAMVFIGGRYSHTIRKTAFQCLAPVGGAGESVVEADQAELELANRVLNFLESVPVYARVDVVRDASQRDLVMELELVEPSLYLSMYKPAAFNFARSLCDFAVQ